MIQLTPIALAASIDLGMESESEIVMVKGNSDAINQALICLVENALQFTPPGKDVTIGVTASPPSLTVRDFGAGFAAERKAAYSTVGGGDVHVGLGLRIARQVAEAHMAELSIAQAPQGGAAVSLTFPAARHP